MGMSRLTSNSYKKTVGLLDNLAQLLNGIPSEYLSQNLISYIFLPLSSLLQRNPSSQIPDQILEKILRILALLVESWWWTCDIKVWEQIFMLCGAVVGGVKTKDTKENSRDDETKEAAASCLYALLHPRTSNEALERHLSADQPKERLSELQFHAQTSTFIPVIGQSLDSLLTSSASRHLPLQRISLDIIAHLIELYLPDPMLPSILPGVVSTMTKICVGVTQGKGWTNGDTVIRALLVIQAVIIKAVNDEICIKCGALRAVRDLDDLANFNDPPQATSTENPSAYGTVRTESWLRGTRTQLHIAINSLTPLLSHSNAAVLRSLTDFSEKLIEATPLALPQTHPLLLSFLLSLSLSDYTSVSSKARQSLLTLLSQPSRPSLQQILMDNLGSNLSALPRLLSTQTDAKILHSAGLIEAVCKLTLENDSYPGLAIVAKGVGKLLGPTGGIEKWGWSLLTVLELIEPPIVVTRHSSAQLMLEDDSQAQQATVFPELRFKNVQSSETRSALVNMLHALGAASGDAGLFAVEWFFRTGCSATSATSVTALWCACRLLEGITSVSLFDGPNDVSSRAPFSRRLEKQNKLFARSIAEIWNQSDPLPREIADASENHDISSLVQHQSGLVPLHETLKIISPTKSSRTTQRNQPIIHRALCLQILAISAGFLKERFSLLFIHTLYPVLHSLVSPISFLSASALSTLNFIAVATSFASPANLLLSNFDYILDSVSRRLTHRWLDLDATKVLGILVRLVGADIVEQAGDIVEECFDRLDEFHGYGVIVDGLVEVLNEVLKAIELEEKASKTHTANNPQTCIETRRAKVDDFLAFLAKRNDDPVTDNDNADYGPAPREPWGKKKVEDEESPEAESEQLKSVPSSDEPPLTTTQSLTKQIIARSMYFLTHDSPVIRAKILTLLTLAVPILSESSLLPSIHSAWPFILNRMDDSETFVVSTAAGLVEALAEHVGDFMFRRIWDDIWPRFRSMLSLLEKGEATNALSRREGNRIRTESAYTHSHRLYRSLMKTMTVALKGVYQHEPSFWEVIVAFRRFLSSHAHEELQRYAVNLYMQASKQNPDAVWFLLTSTAYDTELAMAFLKEPKWEIEKNAIIILQSLE